MNKSLLITALAALGVSAMAQSGSSNRYFSYLGDQDQSGKFYFLSDNGTGAWGNTMESDLYHTVVSANTRVYVKSYVYISGSFDAQYSVGGYGAGSEGSGVVNTQSVTVLTNRSLHAYPIQFTSLQDTNGNTFGHLDFQLYFTAQASEYSPTTLGQGAHWTDNNYGSAIAPADLNLANVYSEVQNGTLPETNGVFGLVLSRHLYNLNSLAQGNQTYISHGAINIAVY